ncbi:hypothetical protein C1645_824035 [Glomus cerebriforme]|uniref:Tr-type G domain-containing protein n=1 Tax=Glomus cerebriforme TaxID=658196 RepID=A0A397SZ93_9GLOM|nr:hypothetical protein C1645_824035 [Glomus cerebriforme]
MASQDPQRKKEIEAWDKIAIFIPNLANNGRDGKVMVDQIKGIDKKRLSKKTVNRLTEEQLTKINEIIHATLEIAQVANLIIQPTGVSRADLVPAVKEFNALVKAKQNLGAIPQEASSNLTAPETAPSRKTRILPTVARVSIQRKLLYGGKDEKSEKLSRVRNIGVSAHVDAGKTTLTERILYLAEKIRKVGDVQTGNTDAK